MDKGSQLIKQMPLRQFFLNFQIFKIQQKNK
jgi:hypothetical protein